MNTKKGKTMSATTTASKSKTTGGGIFRKLLEVQKKVDAVPKKGYNAFHKYHYATEADILTVKQTLNDHGLVVLPTTLEEETGFRDGGRSWARVTLLFKVIDVDSGEEIESRFTGYAEDNNDKAIYKATTGANKYFYLKFFGIATEDDPEREEAPHGKPNLIGGKAPARGTGKAAAPAGAQRNQALINANKILSLQKQYGLSNEDVLEIGGIESIRDLAEAGDSDALAQAYNRLSKHVQVLKAI